MIIPFNRLIFLFVLCIGFANFATSTYCQESAGHHSAALEISRFTKELLTRSRSKIDVNVNSNLVHMACLYRYNDCPEASIRIALKEFEISYGTFNRLTAHCSQAWCKNEQENNSTIIAWSEANPEKFQNKKIPEAILQALSLGEAVMILDQLQPGKIGKAGDDVIAPQVNTSRAVKVPTARDTATPNNEEIKAGR